MRLIYTLAILAFCAVLPAWAQRPTFLSFPDTPCDVQQCDSVVWTNPSSFPEDLIGIDMRDSTSYRVGAGVSLPISISAGQRFALPICFSPDRRGTIIDSLRLYVRLASNKIDTISVRLTGRGIGPELSATPTVLNFPRTNPGNTSSQKITFTNHGELTVRLTASMLQLPAPFRLITLLPVNLDSGESIEVEVMFEPTEKGVYSQIVNLPAGCTRQLQLALNASTDLIGTGAVLQASKINFNPVNSEIITCDGNKCTNVTVANAGNAPLMIDSLAWANGTIGYGITPQVQLPLVVPPNEQRVIQVCLNSTSRGMLRDTLVFRSNTRNSIAFGLIVDCSGSMRDLMSCGSTSKSRIEIARERAHDFLERTLLHIPSIGLQDQIAINRYGTTVEQVFPLQNVTDPVRAQAVTIVDNMQPNLGRTYTGDALIQMMDVLANSPLQNRVIVLMTDGAANDNNPNDPKYKPINQLTSYARARGIKIFTVGIDLASQSNDAVQYINNLASGTGAVSFDASNCDSLQYAFEQITDLLSRGSVHREPFSIKVTAPLLVSSGLVKFDTTRLGDTLCSSVTLTNVGEGEATVSAGRFLDLAGNPNGEFFFDAGVSFPINIPENGQVTLNVCFRPTGLREREGSLKLTYNDCGGDELGSPLQGSSYGEANLRLNDMRVAMPGDTVTLPVYSDTSLALFNVHTITYQIRWNKSMLDLVSLLPGPDAPEASVSFINPITYQGRYAIADIMISSGETAPLQRGGQLALLKFKMYRGDTLATMVELTEGKFEDDNPRIALVGDGLVVLDSACFRELKPITVQGAAARVSVGDVTPTPSTSHLARIPVDASEETVVFVEIYSTDGKMAMGLRSFFLDKGPSEVALDLDQLTSGSYYALIRTAAGEIHTRKIVIP